MPEPITIGAIAVGGLAWVWGAALPAVAGGVAGNISDRKLSDLTRGLKDRIAGLRGLPENHDVARAVRTAQIQALEMSIRDYREIGQPEWKREQHTRPDMFFELSLAFCSRTVGRCLDPKIKLNLEVGEILTAAIDGILAKPVVEGPTAERADALASFAEEAVLQELQGELKGVVLPEGFESHFRTGGGVGRPRFLDLFGAQIGQQIKQNGPFYRILTVGKLSGIEALAFDIAELLDAMDGRFSAALVRIEEDFRAIRENVERLTRQLAMTAAEKEALAVELAKVKAELGGTVSLVAGFLETMVGRKVPPEQFPATLFKLVENWKSAREEIGALSFSANLSPGLAKLRDDAKAAHEVGHLDEAARLLAAIARIESEVLRKLESHELEVESEVKLRRLGIAETRAAQAAVARARLAYRDASEYYSEAARVASAANPERARDYRIAKGDVLRVLGMEFGDRAAFAESIEEFGRILVETDRAVEPIVWARLQDQLGVSLFRLGEGESGTERLAQSVTAFRAALEEFAPERGPLEWAKTLTNLGMALRAIGERKGGTNELKDAVAVYHAALKECTRERAPLDWASTLNGLGNALHLLGSREDGTAQLEEAVVVFSSALEVQTRERRPFEWAKIANNIGNVLSSLGQREGNAVRLEQAVVAYRAALLERTRERVPLDWAMTQNNLAVALLDLGNLESGTARLREAVGAFHAALQERTRERTPLGWAITTLALANALRVLGERQHNIPRLKQSVAACKAALEELTRARVPHLWAMAQKDLCMALVALGEHESGTMWLDEAVAAYRAVLEEYTRETSPPDWAMTQTNLGNALLTLGEREGGTARLEEAVAAYRAALEEDSRETAPLDWAVSYGNQGVALMRLAERRNDRAMAETALTQITEAEKVMRDGGHGPFAAYFAAKIPEARVLVDRLRAG